MSGWGRQVVGECVSEALSLSASECLYRESQIVYKRGRVCACVYVYVNLPTDMEAIAGVDYAIAECMNVPIL